MILGLANELGLAVGTFPNTLQLVEGAARVDGVLWSIGKRTGSDWANMSSLPVGELQGAVR